MSNKTGGVYTFGAFHIDVSERELSLQGRPIPLPPKVFDVLFVLVENAGRIVGKDELMSQVWTDAFVEDANLTVNISALRKVLSEDAGASPFIETLPKRGYRFVAPVSHHFDENTHLDEITDVWPRLSPRINGLQPSANDIEATENFNVLPKLARTNVGSGAEFSKDQQTDVSDSPTDGLYISRRFALLVIAVVAIVIAGYFLSRWPAVRSDTAGADSPIDSIAVLPFENGSPDANTEYLSDGITESLIIRLSQLSNLRVMSRSSSFRYKGKEQDTQKVGDDLKVRAVLTGSIKEVGDQLVVIVRLDDAQKNKQIWGEQYVRKFDDVLNVQSEIAQAVSTRLRLKLSGLDEQQLAKRYTSNAEAYQLYLKGNYKWNKHTEEDLWSAIEYFNQAIEKDPNYALAYTGLANSYGVLGNNYLPPHIAFPKARAYAAKALEIDETLGEAHTSMAAVRLFYDWNWADAETEVKRAQALNPSDAGAYDLYSVYLEVTGHLDEARGETRRALELDPLSLMFSTNIGTDSYYARQYDESIEQLEKTITLDPHYNLAYLWLGQAFEQKKMYAEAIAAFQKGINQGERAPKLLAALGSSYALDGEQDKADKILKEMREVAKRRYISPYLFAIIYNGMGDKEQTFKWLDRAVEDRSVFMIWLKYEPRFDSLREEPRFKELLRRIGLPS